MGLAWFEPVTCVLNHHMAGPTSFDFTLGNYDGDHKVTLAFQTDQFSQKDVHNTFAKQAKDKTQDEVATFKERIIKLRNKGKLRFRKIVPCKSVESFGSYTPM